MDENEAAIEFMARMAILQAVMFRMSGDTRPIPEIVDELTGDMNFVAFLLTMWERDQWATNHTFPEL